MCHAFVGAFVLVYFLRHKNFLYTCTLHVSRGRVKCNDVFATYTHTSDTGMCMSVCVYRQHVPLLTAWSLPLLTCVEMLQLDCSDSSGRARRQLSHE